MFGGELLEEALDQQRNVLGPLAQRRHDDGHDLQPVKQVLAELARRHRLLQLLVGGGDDAHVDADQFGAADHAERAVLQHAQQVALALGREVADLVQEQRAAVGQLEAARLVGDRAR